MREPTTTEYDIVGGYNHFPTNCFLLALGLAVVSLGTTTTGLWEVEMR